MRVLVVTVLSLLTLGSLAQANDYVYRDGYWWSGGSAYTRTLVQGTGYYRCGYYYPGSSYYSYTYSHATPVVAAYVPPAVPAYGPHWKEDIVSFVKQKDDHLAYLGALKIAGVNSNVYDYGFSASYAGYLPAAQGNTVFGYATVQQLQAAYGNLDVNVANQAFARNVHAVKESLDLAVDKQGQLVDGMNQFSQRLQEYFVKQEAASKLLKDAARAVEPQAQTITQTTAQVPYNPQPGAPQPPIVQQTAGNGFAALAMPMCGSCHSGKNVMGSLDIGGQLTAHQKSAIWERLTTQDPAKRMPRDAKDRNKPGTPLTAQQMFDVARSLGAAP